MQNLRAARQLHDRMRALADPGRALWQWHEMWVRVQFGGLTGDPPIGDEDYARLIRTAQSTGMVYIQIISRIAWTHQLAPYGRSDRLSALVGEARALCTGSMFAYLDNELRLAEALAAMRSRDSTGDALMAGALEEARRFGYPYPTRVYSGLLAHVCATALEAGIEPEYARLLVRRFNLQAVARSPDAWPWPVKIFTLGRFEVQVDDIPLRFIVHPSVRHPSRANQSLAKGWRRLLTSGRRRRTCSAVHDALHAVDGEVLRIVARQDRGVNGTAAY